MRWFESTSCVASDSAAAVSIGGVITTVGFTFDVSTRASTTRGPRFAPVASMMVMFADSAVALLPAVRNAGSAVSSRKRIGPSSVAITNHFVRTRSRYSRRMIAISLPMAAHPRFDARRADLLEEDAMQRRLHTLEALQ